MLLLDNGIRVIPNKHFGHIWVSISDFGFEHDHDFIYGTSHLLEHIFINPDPGKYVFNGYTTRNGMVFWCKAKPPLTQYDAVGELCSWFFHPDGRLKVDIIEERISNYFDELEHEWTYRVNSLNLQDPLYALQNMDQVMCGRKEDFVGKEALIRQVIRKRFLELGADQITIMCTDPDPYVMELLNSTYGMLRRHRGKFSYPPFNIPDRTHNENVFIVGSRSQVFQVHIKLPQEELAINTAVALNTYQSNVELKWLSGEPWVVFYYSTEEEAMLLLKNLSRGELSPLYINNAYRTDIADTVALLYARNYMVRWDPWTSPDLSNIDLEILRMLLQESIKQYGNVFIQIPNTGPMSTYYDSKGVPGMSWAVHINLNAADNFIALQNYKSQSHMLSFNVEKHCLGESYDLMLSCNMHKKAAGPKESASADTSLIVYHTTTPHHVMRVAQFFATYPVRLEVYSGVLVSAIGALPYLEAATMKKGKLTPQLLKVLLELYFRLGVHPGIPLETFPAEDFPGYDIMATQDMCINKTKFIFKQKKTQLVVVTPFSWVAVYIQGNQQFTEKDYDTLLWNLKRKGSVYEIYCNRGPDGVYLFSNTFKQFTTERNIKNELAALGKGWVVTSVISVISDGFSFGSLD